METWLKDSMALEVVSCQRAAAGSPRNQVDIKMEAEPSHKAMDLTTWASQLQWVLVIQIHLNLITCKALMLKMSWRQVEVPEPKRIITILRITPNRHPNNTDAVKLTELVVLRIQFSMRIWHLHTTVIPRGISIWLLSLEALEIPTL